MKITTDIQGLEFLERQLKEVAEAAAPKVVRASLREEAKPLKTEMEQSISLNFQAQTGQLENSVQIKTVLNKKGDHALYDAAVYVGVYNVRSVQKMVDADIPAAVYAYWLETGVKPHDLNRASKRSRGKIGEGANNFHPGIAPTPFIRPPLIRNEQNVIDGFGQGLKRRLDKLSGNRPRKI